jgi:hypothetical protein
MSHETRPVDARTSRRAVLTAGLGTGAVAVVATVANALPAAAGNGAPITVGAHLTGATSVTSLTNNANNADVFKAVSAGDGDALVGKSGTAYGVHGETESTYAAGVFGLNMSQTGFSIGTSGVSHGTKGVGAAGWAMAGGCGVAGSSGPNVGTIPAKVGVFGYSEAGTAGQGVRAESPTGRGVVASGSLAQLRLIPSTQATHPSSGMIGDLFLDKNKRLWFCKGGTTWVQIA